MNAELQIQHIFEPDRLKLIWQSSSEDGDRTNYHVADLFRREGKIYLAYQYNSEDYKKACEAGFKGYSRFSPSSEVSFIDVGDTFFRRLPPRSRGDFVSYLSGFGLAQHKDVSDFALLGYTGATLPGDTFYCIFYYEDMPMPVEFVMHVAGFRHAGKDNIDLYKEILARQEKLSLRAEPENEHDDCAISLYHGDSKIGYVNRNSTGAFGQWMENNTVELSSFRINGTASRPRLLAFVSVK